MNRRRWLEQDLRARLARTFKEDAVEDAFWSHLDERGYVKDALTTENGWQDLADYYRALRSLTRSLQGRASPSGRSSRWAQQDVDPQITGYEAARATAFELAAANHAAATNLVRRFREDILGRRLTTDDARRFVASPAARLFPFSVFAEHGIPVVGHVARVHGIKRILDGRRWQITLVVDPPGKVFDAYPPRRPEGPEVFETVAARREDGGWDDFRVWPRSVLDELRRLSSWLTDQCPWDQREAEWFVLTGERPQIAPVRTKKTTYGWVHDRFRRGTVTLTVEPWVSADTVLRAYRFLQRSMLGGDNRPIGERNLALLHFVLERLDAEGKRPPWRALMEEWNRIYQVDVTYDDPDLFARDFRRAERAVRFPTYDSKEDQDTGTRTSPDKADGPVNALGEAGDR